VLGDRLKGIYEDVVPPSRLYAVPNFAKDEFFVAPSDIAGKFHYCPVKSRTKSIG